MCTRRHSIGENRVRARLVLKVGPKTLLYLFFIACLMFKAVSNTLLRPLFVGGSLILATLALASCRNAAVTPPPDGEALQMTAIRFDRVPSWNEDSHSYALKAFLTSCDRISKMEARNWFGPTAQFGTVAKWQDACGNAAVVRRDDFSAKEFFEANFRPYEVAGTGTFTGYYEVEVPASRTRAPGFAFPVYARPSDLSARSPYYSRAQIDGGALAGRGLEIMWLQTAADAFLLHVQGSGAVQLPDGTNTRLSYAANNGHDFKSIYGALQNAGYDPSVEGGSMVDFRRWLNENPSKAMSVIQANPRFIFFVESDGNGPIGAQGVELTPGRSLAVDDEYVAYGVPIFINTAFIDPAKNNARQDLERLVIAQDTGSAINGKVRGDFFWGTGERALQYAGRMKEEGRYYLLLPR